MPIYLLSLFLAAPPVAEKRVAVLELQGESLSRVERVYLTDRVRAVLFEGMTDEWLMLTRENLQALLPPGVDLAECEGECEVETGRNIGVDRVVSGRVAEFAGGMHITLNVHDTADGRLLATAEIEAAEQAGLDAAAEHAAGQLTRRLWPLTEPERPLDTVEPTRLTRLEAKVFTPKRRRPTDSQYLLVKTEPPGALVTADGVRAGYSPVRVDTSVKRSFEITVKQQDHRTRTFIVAVPPGPFSEVRIPMASSLGVLVVQATLAGLPIGRTHVHLDGRELGPAPLIRKVAAGAHTVRVEHPCAEPFEEVVEIEAGGRVVVRAPIESRCGQIEVVTIPPGAAIELDGRVVERGESMFPKSMQAPGNSSSTLGKWTSDAIEPGPRLVSVRRAGYVAVRREVVVKPGEVSRLRLVLERLESQLEVRVQQPDGSPCQGEIEINGEAHGTVPWKGTLLARPYRVGVDCPGGGVKTRFELTAGEERRLDLTSDDRNVEWVFAMDRTHEWTTGMRYWSGDRVPGALRPGIEVAMGGMRLDTPDDEGREGRFLFRVGVGALLNITRDVELGLLAGFDTYWPIQARGLVRWHLPHVTLEGGYGASVRFEDDVTAHGPHVGFVF